MKRATLLAALLLAVALAMRLFAVWLARDGVPFGDAMEYLRLARNVAAGEGLRYASAVPAGEMYAVYPPAYPVLLAGWSHLAPLTSASLALFNSLFDLVSAGLIAALARAGGQAPAGPWVALAYLVWPAAAFSVPLAEKESLEVMLVLASALAVVRLGERASAGRVVIAGLAAAGLVLTQPSLALLPPLFFALLRGRFRSTRDWTRAALASAVVAAALMVPWWARNFNQFHQFVPLTTSGGRSLWVGARPDGGAAWHPYPRAWQGLGELAFDAQARAVALATIAADPLGWLGRCLWKLPESYLRPHYALGVLALMRPTPMPGLFDHRLLLQIPTALELVATLFGLYAAFRFPRTLASRLLSAVLGYTLFVTIWFEFSERHRVALAPFVLLATAQIFMPPTQRRNETPSGAL